ncbi:hypothetical protein A9R05_22075 [Burkholderia sp. KK1]|nr:hypothetical protein A9R05_22075 [Burkholderia sp. KK1]
MEQYKCLSARAESLILTRCHLALEAFLAGKGSAGMARTLFEVLAVANLLPRPDLNIEFGSIATAAKDAIGGAINSGASSGRWVLERDEFAAMCDLVEVFEAQLDTASAAELQRAFEQATGFLR